ncbi:MAG: type II toxin-antitoxin system RelE/ParE family toxin [Planctomycetes bacterium]|nr:type II toxin-antitoxin system RelE/ParE family toxin [Planctomycetota bacterium]
MRLRSVIRPRAQADIEEAFDYYVREAGIEIADRFVDCVAKTLELISSNPSIGSPRRWMNPSLSNLRSWHVGEFDKFRVYYVIQPETIEVVRVLHGAREVRELLSE